MSAIFVRRARPDEMAIVGDLRWRWTLELEGQPAPVTREEFGREFADWARRHAATHHCFVLDRDAEVIGMAWLAVSGRPPGPHSLDRLSGDLQSVYVTPDARNGGLGGLLVEAVLGLAREMGLEHVTVHAADRAIGAYARRGFAPSPTLMYVTF